ncbi:hypothetical protein N7492_009390 [Penicillium capsulatum]|uniref:DUF7707 domain-containing protein n=1 Tax=Penicillium capsulatum TaxID=69766 RepID=A0A9W9HSS9_9EURO|nr:hypothetical protein N7492_009390 [Penicillium capsulatum]KAJ6106783.1 hypothetical protein N7512_010300 [Penicillium capsulatum]
MLSSLLLGLASVATLVSSQSTASINPNSVDLGTRQAWCQSQTSSCPLLCLQIPGASGSPTTNTCSPQTLAYQCICSNQASPNASEYSQTMAYYICTEANNQCVNKCTSSACQDACRADHPCGAQDPKRVNVTTTSTAMTSTSMPSLLRTNEPTGAAPRGSIIDMARVYGACVLVGGFIAGFAILL